MVLLVAPEFCPCTLHAAVADGVGARIEGICTLQVFLTAILTRFLKVHLPAV